MALILVVDDEPDIRLVLCRMLESAGYETLEAGNGKEAANHMQSHAIDLVVTDLVMPEQEGIETIKLFRKEHPQVKIIAMSGAFGGEFLTVAGMLGANSTLQKPLRLDKVISTVKTVLAG